VDYPLLTFGFFKLLLGTVSLELLGLHSGKDFPIDLVFSLALLKAVFLLRELLGLHRLFLLLIFFHFVVLCVLDTLGRVCMLSQVQSPRIELNMRCGIITLASVAHLRVSGVIPLVFAALTETFLTLHSHRHHTMLVVSILAFFLLLLALPSIFSNLLVLREDTFDLNKGLLPLQGIRED
jgi:hypothetical protein